MAAGGEVGARDATRYTECAWVQTLVDVVGVRALGDCPADAVYRGGVSFVAGAACPQSKLDALQALQLPYTEECCPSSTSVQGGPPRNSPTRSACLFQGYPRHFESTAFGAISRQRPVESWISVRASATRFFSSPRMASMNDFSATA